jgi:uncharacterized protein
MIFWVKFFRGSASASDALTSEVLLLCGFAFLAGLVDAVAGGGGLIQVPALFAVFPSASPAALLGTNKLSSIAGTAMAALRFGWSVPINWRVVLPAAVVAGIGALFGAKAVTLLDPALLRPMVLTLLAIVVLHTLAQRLMGQVRKITRTARLEAPGVALLGGIIGFYDGFFGPGAGSFLVFGLVKLFGYDFLGATAASKVLNLATNFGALVLFATTDNVLYAVGLPMAFCNIGGGLLGAHLAISRGNTFIRGMFLVVVAGLMIKIAIDLYSQG